MLSRTFALTAAPGSLSKNDAVRGTRYALQCEIEIVPFEQRHLGAAAELLAEQMRTARRRGQSASGPGGQRSPAGDRHYPRRDRRSALRLVGGRFLEATGLHPGPCLHDARS
ncbi:MAG: hypothetical protein IH859_08825 [Chloroflexi bacterium]|nr:hypothetical protein [Chloroflexota bacterium]